MESCVGRRRRGGGRILGAMQARRGEGGRERSTGRGGNAAKRYPFLGKKGR
jgi:hypothetical protein